MKLKSIEQLVKELFESGISFQLKSGTEKLKSTESFFVDGARDTQQMERSSHNISYEKARYIANIVKKNYTTIETGGGHSTVVFGATAKKHYCVNPDITANRMIKNYLTNSGFDIRRVKFVEESSDLGFAQIKDVHIDVALIDGNHSFPYPILDWHHIDLMMREGGLMIIDDAQINSVKLLLKMIDMEKCYKYEKTIKNCLVYRKFLPSRMLGWSGQLINSGKVEFSLDSRKLWP